MRFAVRESCAGAPPRSALAASSCPQCRQEALALTRRHVSPPRLGEPLVTEYYECACCDARYQYTPADDRWKPLYQ
jgi:hypothetical protein